MAERDEQKREARHLSVGGNQATQLSLLESQSITIAGFAYRRDLVSPGQERALVELLSGLKLNEFEFHGYFGRRRVISFGLCYDFGDSKVHPAPDIPSFLLPLRQLAAEFAGIGAGALRHALVTEYQPGAAIGWHSDRPIFKDVIGVSLLSPRRLRFRRRTGATWQRQSLIIEPRSAYLLRGEVREAWEHSIPPVENLRYSVTFRSLRSSTAK
jgi:alkylated DNA repair dioxygenase AlkB